MELRSVRYRLGKAAEKVGCFARGVAIRGREIKQEYPLRVLAAIGIAAVTSGILLRVWRSQT